MPISCECPSCGKRLKAPDSAAGKRAKCPQCGNPVTIPAEKVYEAEEVAEDADDVSEDEFGLQTPGDDDPVQRPAIPDRRHLPACGEMIAAAAVKCRYCGEFLDASLNAKSAHRRRGVSKEDEELQAIDWVACLLCSAIGCILSIVYLIQGKPKAGKMLGISLGMIVFWNFAMGILGAILEQLGKNH